MSDGLKPRCWKRSGFDGRSLGSGFDTPLSSFWLVLAGFGPILARSGPILPVLARSGPILARSGPILACSLTRSGLILARSGWFWAHSGPFWAHSARSGPFWAHSSAFWAHSGSFWAGFDCSGLSGEAPVWKMLVFHRESDDSRTYGAHRAHPTGVSRGGGGGSQGVASRAKRFHSGIFDDGIINIFW